MGEPEQTDSGEPGVHGFAKSFAATLRRPGEQDKPNVVSRMVVICLTVAVIVGGAVGVGMLLSYQRQQTNKEEAASTVALQTNASPSSAGTTSAKPGATKHTSAPSPARKAAGAVPAGSQDKSTSQLTTSQAGSGSTTGSGSGSTGSTGSTTTGGGSGSTSSGSGGTTSKSTSTTAPLPTRSIVSYASSRCIDVTNGQATAGTPLQIWDCNGANGQQWSFPSDGTVRSLGMCMAVAGGSTADGAAIELETCNGSAAQKFTLNSSYDLVNTQADACVDVKDEQTANGTPLQLWSCAGTSNQKWHLG